MADKPTLTPNLELAFRDSSDSGIVTCWKPLKGDVSKKGEPTITISDSQRTAMIDRLSVTDFPGKNSVLEFIKKAETILPPSRLVAIGTFTNANKWQLYMHSPSKDGNFLKRYVNDHEDLVKSVEEVLGNVRIEFFDPTFNNRSLAEDIVHAWVEHKLLHISSNLRENQQNMDKEYFAEDMEQFAMESDLGDLQEVQFQEPLYERYRNMLISQIRNFLQKLSP